MDKTFTGAMFIWLAIQVAREFCPEIRDIAVSRSAVSGYQLAERHKKPFHYIFDSEVYPFPGGYRAI